MALAHFSGGEAGQHGSAGAGGTLLQQLMPEPMFKGVDTMRGVGPAGAELVEIDFSYRKNPCGGAEGAGRAGGVEAGVDAGDFGTDRLAISHRESRRGKAAVELVLVVKLHELDGPFDRLARAADLRVFAGSGDRQGLEIELGGESLIESHLFAAEVGPAFQRGKIEVSKRHRFFEFVDERAGEEHPGDVGFDEADRAGRVGIGGGIEEPLDEQGCAGRWRGSARSVD